MESVDTGESRFSNRLLLRRFHIHALALWEGETSRNPVGAAFSLNFKCQIFTEAQRLASSYDPSRDYTTMRECLFAFVNTIPLVPPPNTNYCANFSYACQSLGVLAKQR
ncbi:hypothetical protein M0804_005384 [Polistes exclamans]|nr:hypothetical protein M0804_005384 [Polistes exclamans]